MLELAFQYDTGAKSTWRNTMNCADTGAVMQDKRAMLLKSYEEGNREFCGWQLDGIDLSNCILDDIDLSRASLVGANLRSASMKSSILTEAKLSQASLSRANLSKADISRADFTNTDLVGIDLRKSLARATNFTHALMLRSRLDDADCLGAIMVDINATAARMESANLECVDFSGAAMMNCVLTGASCSWANMTDTRLNWAQMSWCKLEAADLEQANLTGANLRGANISFANLDQAILTGADLYFANISGALVPADIQPARVASLRLTNQTFTRSNWSKKTLYEWQQRGAIIIDFESLPRDVLTYVRKGECNLRIYFSTTCSPNGQVALEALMTHISPDADTLRILSVSNDAGKSVVAFYAPNPHTIDVFTSALRNKTWTSDREALEQRYRDSCVTREKSVDIIAELENLASHIFHIQALVPIANDDKTKQLQMRLDPCEIIGDKAQISWSSVSLPKVSR